MSATKLLLTVIRSVLVKLVDVLIGKLYRQTCWG